MEGNVARVVNDGWDDRDIVPEVVVHGWDESVITWVKSVNVWRDEDVASDVVINATWDGSTVEVMVVEGWDGGDLVSKVKGPSDGEVVIGEADVDVCALSAVVAVPAARTVDELEDDVWVICLDGVELTCQFGPMEN